MEAPQSEADTKPYFTSGERLVEFLRVHVVVGLDDLTNLKRASRSIRRSDFMAVACEQLVLMNALERLMSLAAWARRVEPEAVLVETLVRERLLDELEIDYSLVPRVWWYLEPAIAATNQEPSPTLRREVLATAGPNCYVCGGALVAGDSTVDHVWPRSLGGESVYENLLPCCGTCNSHRGNTLNWARAWFQALSAPPMPHASEREPFELVKTRIAGLYFRAFLRSRESGQSMRDSLLHVGPCVDHDLSDSQAPLDFFRFACLPDQDALFA